MNQSGLNARWIIKSAILVLAIFVCVLSARVAWDAYGMQRAVHAMQHANRITDNIILAAAYEAIERGVTSAAIGSFVPVTEERLQRIEQLRKTGDQHWQAALSEARLLAVELDNDSRFTQTLEEAVRASDRLQAARRLAWQNAREKRVEISLERWVGAITGFINAASALREAAFASIDVSSEISRLNFEVKRRVWVMSEYAGLERAHIGFVTASRQPISEERQNELLRLRGVVEHTYDDLARLMRDEQGLDPRLREAFHRMEEHFFGHFQKTREAIYAAADTGTYPITDELWIDRATAAINTILEVGKVVTAITEERAAVLARESLYRLVFQSGLMVITLFMALWSLTKVRQTVNILFHQKELAEVTLHSIGDAVITTDARARVEYLNPIAEELTGWKSKEAHGRPLKEVFNIVNGFTMEAEPNPVEECLREGHVVGLGSNTVLRRPDGREFMVEDSAAPIRNRNGEVVGAVMVFYDVSAMRNTPHLLSYHATHDALTGLYNRREFERRLAELLVSAKNERREHALCYMDLDQFKLVNDTCGHIVGDKLLRQLTYLLKEHVRDSDILARLGGDEFGLLLQNCPLDRALQIADSLRKVVRDFRFVWQGKSFEVGASIGLVPINADSISPTEILSEADAACYAAKEKGRNRVQIYQPGDLELAQRHGEMQWVARINESIKDDRFTLYCQPIQSLDGHDSPRYFEFLLRLHDEQGELVEPMAFIPAAERYNLMPAIDYWVIKNALYQLGRYYQRQVGEVVGLVCTINLSGATLSEEGLYDYILEQLALHCVPPQAVCFEITETVAVSNLDQAAQLIKALREQGCRFALDDFGSGLCSFGYLKSLPVDYLKIDGAFVKSIHEDEVNHAVVQSITHIARILNMQTIAEFVEDEAIKAKLQELGVDYAQGFGIGRPAPHADYLGAL